MSEEFEGLEGLWDYDETAQRVSECDEPFRAVCDLEYAEFPEVERHELGRRIARIPLMEDALEQVREILESCWSHTKEGVRVAGDNPRSCSDVNDDLLMIDELIHKALGLAQPEEVEETDDTEFE